MNPILFDVCWILGGTLGALVLFKGFHAGWFIVRKQIPPVVRIPDEAQIFRSAKSIVRLEERRVKASPMQRPQ